MLGRGAEGELIHLLRFEIYNLMVCVCLFTYLVCTDRVTEKWFPSVDTLVGNLVPCLVLVTGLWGGYGERQWFQLVVELKVMTST